MAWGMIAASSIAADMSFCPRSVYERVRDATLQWGKLPAVTVQTAKVIKLIKSDKKTEAGVFHFVLPKKIGQVEVVNNVPEEAIAAAMAEIRKASRG